MQLYKGKVKRATTVERNKIDRRGQQLSFQVHSCFSMHIRYFMPLDVSVEFLDCFTVLLV